MHASVEEKSGSGPRVTPPGLPLTLYELDAAVQSVEPAALLILPRILRRVIKQDRQLTGWALKVPHRKSYLISRDRLLEFADPVELDSPGGEILPEKVILLPRPEPETLLTTNAGDILTRYWRLLFHARVHQTLDEAVDRGELSASLVRQRIEGLGTVEFDEIRSVLQHEAYLFPPYDDVQIYIEFAAVYLELRYFAPSLVARYFPALEDSGTADRVLANDIDGRRLFQATRLGGAPDPVDVSAVHEWEDWSDDSPNQAHRPVASHPDETRFHRLMRSAERAAAEGNIVGSLIYRARSVQYSPPEAAARARTAVRISLDRLVRRLQQALEIPSDDLKQWRDPLLALVYQSPYGVWTAEARLLYDLQKVCVDFERGIYTVDLVEWALSWGSRPIKRPLPSQRDVLMSKHLRSAAARLPVVRLSDSYRRQLSTLLRVATEQAEDRLRHHFRPRLTDALESVGLQPKNVPERVARNKIVEELLDKIVERGFLAMGDLRDALSRNNLKLPDFSEPADLFHGDQLLRADRRLATTLDGVYRRGEFYLRWMQQLSSLAFGTGVGRFLTRYVAVPFGGSYVALAGLQHLIDKVAGRELEIKTTFTVVAFGLFLLALFNVKAFRQGVWQALRLSGRVFHDVVINPVVAVIHSQLIQRVLHSRTFRVASRFLLKPLILAGGVYLLLPMEWVNTRQSIGIAAGAFLLFNLVLNSRAGREVEEVATDWIVQGWHRFGVRILAGMFWLVMDVFKSVLEGIERLLYTVDEWLRFRTGDSRLSLGVKAVLGLLWFFLTYVIRFCVNLLIEPQINPIKHFPVVTVSHKLLFPCIPMLAGVLELTMEKGLAITVATAIIFCIPGIFGFLVWELKENWRLYAANRSPTVCPVPIGHHAETMARFLKPGFHSGTIPKRFAKLRRAERKARASGSWKAVRKHLHVLQHLGLSIRRFVERELLALLAESPAWQGLVLEPDSIHLASNRVRVLLKCPPLGDAPLEIVFALESNCLSGSLILPAWISQLSVEQRQVLARAVTGLFVMARADRVALEAKSSLVPAEPIAWQAWIDQWDKCQPGQAVSI